MSEMMMMAKMTKVKFFLTTGILPKLEDSRYFKKVEFASPTIRDTRLKADRFIIKMEIETPSAEKETE